MNGSVESLHFHNGLFGFINDQPFKVRIADDAPDEDWKTASTHNIKPIPKGTELIVELFVNFYGTFLKAEYNGWIYYISPRLCDFIK